jgi:predicted NBD/HSP70 family sugar kinase
MGRRTRRGSLGSLREQNRDRVVAELRRRGTASQADIARATGLSRSTVSSLVHDLRADGLVVEREASGDGSGATGSGRPPVLLRLDRSAGAAVGVDFGHRHLRVAVADLSHEVLAEHWRDLDVDHSAEAGLAAAEELVEGVLDEAGVSRASVLGVGLGLPGPISAATGTVGSSSILPGWVGVDPEAELSERLGLPILVENDANLGALAELASGAGNGASEVAYIKVASGIGAGLIVGGRPYHGAGGTAGEIGHTQVDEEGPVCRCGNRGCLETLAAGSAVAKVLGASRGEDLTVRQAVELAAEGDAAARRVIGDAGRHIGVAVASLLNLFNPQRVIVGGELAAAGEVLLGPLADTARRYAIPSAAEEVEIVQGVLGERAEVLGALALVVREGDTGTGRQQTTKEEIA